MAQLRAALGLGPGDEEVGMARPYSGYEAQGERLGHVRCGMVHGESGMCACV